MHSTRLEAAIGDRLAWTDRPVAVTFPRLSTRKVTFVVQNLELVIRGAKRLVLKILGLCDGTATAREIVASLPRWQQRRATKLLRALADGRVIVSLQDLYWPMQQYASNSNVYVQRPLSDAALRHIYSLDRFATERRNPKSDAVSSPRHDTLEQLLGRRASAVRPISGPTDMACLIRLAYAASGPTTTGRRTVASAGGLDPTVVFLAAVHDESGERSISWYDDASGTAYFKKNVATAEVAEWFLPDELALASMERGAGILILSADWSRVTAKYGARGYNYGVMEAGAVCQNAYLFAAQEGISVRAYGGFFDDRVKTTLELPFHVHPLLLILVGYETS